MRPKAVIKSCGKEASVRHRETYQGPHQHSIIIIPGEICIHLAGRVSSGIVTQTNFVQLGRR
jgi:hypothetical protein